MTDPAQPIPSALFNSDSWSGLEDLRPVLLKFLIRRCRDRSEADDLVQETLVRAARYRRDLTNRARLRSWIVQIAANVFRDHVRKSSRGPLAASDEDALDQVEAPEPAPAAGDGEAWIELRGELFDKDVVLDDLDQALAGLRARDRLMLDRYYAAGDSTACIARRCGISASLVKVRLFRARRRLERALLLRATQRRTRRLLELVS